MSENQYVSSDVRLKGYNLILKKLDEHKGEYEPSPDEDRLEDLAFRIEQAVYDNSSFNKDYKPHLRNIVANISYTPNAAGVRRRIYSSEWTPEIFGRMSNNEMYPELEEKERLEKEEEKRLEEFFKEKKLNIDSFYTCGKCKSTKVEHTQRQTRSSDEPMTVFCHCLVCEARWKC